MLKKIFISLPLVCLTIFLAAPVASAKEKPVAGVMEMFTHFNELEEEYRAGEWDDALAVAQKIEGSYKKLVPELKGTVDAKVIQKFGFLITSLKKSLEKKDQEEVEKPFLNLQSIFLDVMDYYDYPNPPVLIIIARYVDEAGVAVKKGDIDDAGEEMEEIVGFKDRGMKAFVGKGVPGDEAEAFFALVERGEDLAKNKDGAGMTELLEKLEGIIMPYALDDAN